MTTEDLVRVYIDSYKKTIPPDLSLDGLGLTTFPKEIFEIKDSLRELNLSNNRISEIPDEISCLENLDTIELRANHIATIPKGFTSLKKLKYADLRQNNISRIPDHIQDLVAENLGYKK